jgi:DNA-directed RNA polymerase specialized sigma24 family protein
MARRKHSRGKRRPLLHRAALHALKTLVRKHPRAALSAAGAGAGYAISSVAEDATDAVREVAGEVKEAFTGPAPPRRSFTKRECEDMLGAMTPRQRKAFAALAPKDRK